MSTTEPESIDPFEYGFEEPHTNTKQYQRMLKNRGEEYSSQWRKLHSDADYLRRLHGMPEFDPNIFEYPDLAPNVFDHVWDGGQERVSGGSEFFATGDMGTGKSTAALRFSSIDMNQNDGKVVWRASSGNRTEWTPFAPVARVCIPAGYRARAHLVSVNKSEPERYEIPLESVVREVVHYNDVVDLNQRVLQSGMFHVVYPDPQLRGCQWVYENASAEYQKDTASLDGDLFEAGRDPATHWWFGWALSLVSMGPFPWTTWVCDEAKSLAPEGASKDSFGTYQKVKLLGDAIADFRKNGISGWFFGHKEKHLHNQIRDRIRWRIQMNSSANPVKNRSSTYPVGFETVPMTSPRLTLNMDIGEGLLFNEEHFEGVSWPKIDSPSDKFDLTVAIEKSSSSSATSGAGVVA